MSELDNILKRAMPQNALAIPAVKQEIKALIRELVENRIDMNDFVEKVQAL